MNIFKISWHNLKARPLGTLLSVILFALGVGMISLMLLINHQLESKLERNIKGIDLVVGAKGSPLQLILSSVLHVDFPTGNIPIEEADKLRKNPMVGGMIPMALGDSYEGFRIVGTTHQYAELYSAELADGELWDKNLEVSVGSMVADELGLKVNDHFHSAHGIGETSHTHDEMEFHVSGVLKPTGTVLDQLILTNVESVWLVHADHATPIPAAEADEHDHNHEGEEHVHEDEHQHTNEVHEHAEDEEHAHDGEHADEHSHDDHDHANIEISREGQQLTSLLITYKNPIAAVNLPRMVNMNTNMQAAAPAFEITRLYALMGVGFDTLRILAFIIIIVSGLSIFVALFQSLKERRYEVALMRVMGASRGKLLLMVILEGIGIAIIGYVAGMLLSHGAMEMLSGYLQDSYNYPFSGTILLNTELYLLAGALAIGLVSAIIPAIVAYSTDISDTLSQA